jgi:hypothetical protein
MSLRVICVGLPRTGTESLRYALEILGLTTFPKENEVWQKACEDKDVDWKRAFGKAKVVMGIGAALFCKDISAAHPDAVSILTVRDADEWYESINSTILPYIRSSPKSCYWYSMFQRFTGRNKWDSESALKNAFKHHNKNVKHDLSWSIGDGWKPICDKLDLPIPSRPFPHINARGEWV